MFDLTNKKTFRDLATIWLKLAKESVYPKVMPSNKYLLVVGNKVDQESERTVSKTEAKEFAEEFGAGYFETSAKSGENIDRLLHHCRLCYDNLDSSMVS